MTGEIHDRLQDIFSDLSIEWRCSLIEFGGEADRAHFLIEAHPALEVATLVKNLKTVSSRRIRQEYESHLKSFYCKPYFWNRACAVVSVGGKANIAMLLTYIRNQDEPARLKVPATPHLND